ncbi:D(2) dopamine receptor-like isoform X2 [Acanthaster planci]|uniref:D(2) dopamine receptor-like isoform X2 n=1 Tax=Acanthaster planci TaxID=133434 RepID=A0A8B8A161_ACAPL|nr:D(2) dopamine receptor-like isoform X2 [Acanthaster planci]
MERQKEQMFKNLICAFSAVRGHWGFGLPLCVIYLALDVMLCTASIIHLCAIAVNRYLAVTFPLHFSRERVNSRPRILGTIVPVWMVSLAISIPLFVQGFLDPDSTLQNEGRDCGYFNSTFIVYSSMCSFYVPLAVMIVVDWRAVRKLRGRKKAVEFGEPSPRTPIQQVNSNSTTVSCGDSPAHDNPTANGSKSVDAIRKRSLRITFCAGVKKSSVGYGSTQTEAIKTRQRWMTSKRERRAAKTLVVVFVCFIVLWLPFFVVHLLSGVCSSCHPPNELFIVFTWLGYISSAVNPCIYTCFNLDFRRAFMRIITCDKHPRRVSRHADLTTTHTLRTSLRS